MKALVILSGGQDSTTCLYMAKSQGHDVYAMTFDYGQLHRREIDAAMAISSMAGVKEHEFIVLGENVLRSTSPLVDHSKPLEQYRDHEQMEQVIGDRIELTFVPMRNALFMTLAANRAVALGCGTIWTGICQADNANYPDCRASYLEAFQTMTDEALGAKAAIVRVAHPEDERQFIDIKRLTGSPQFIAPLLTTPKAVSVIIALQLPGCYAALGWSHTAYDGSYPPSGRDHATVLRAHAFEEANVPDPLIVRAVLEGELASWPTTLNYTRHAGALAQSRSRAVENGRIHALNVLEQYLREWANQHVEIVDDGQTVRLSIAS